MGMFDTINVRVPLPDGWAPGDGVMQTKDFENELTTLELREDGTLWVDTVSGAWSDGDTTSPDRWRQIDFHGWFRFYGSERIKPPAEPDGIFRSDEHAWHDYRAKFTDGKLVEIVLITPRSTLDA